MVNPAERIEDTGIEDNAIEMAIFIHGLIERSSDGRLVGPEYQAE